MSQEKVKVTLATLASQKPGDLGRLLGVELFSTYYNQPVPEQVRMVLAVAQEKGLTGVQFPVSTPWSDAEKMAREAIAIILEFLATHPTFERVEVLVSYYNTSLHSAMLAELEAQSA